MNVHAGMFFQAHSLVLHSCICFHFTINKYTHHRGINCDADRRRQGVQVMVGPDMQHNSISSRDAAFFVHESAIHFMVLFLLQTALYSTECGM